MFLLEFVLVRLVGLEIIVPPLFVPTTAVEMVFAQLQLIVLAMLVGKDGIAQFLVVLFHVTTVSVMVKDALAT